MSFESSRSIITPPASAETRALPLLRFRCEPGPVLHYTRATFALIRIGVRQVLYRKGLIKRNPSKHHSFRGKLGKVFRHSLCEHVRARSGAFHQNVRCARGVSL